MRRRWLLSAILIGLVQFAPVGSAAAQTPLDHLPALRGDYFQLESSSTGRPYHIYVRVPEGYDPAAPALYPTVYLTDGDSLFPLLAASHLFLHYDEQLPEALVVGIAYGGFGPEVNFRGVDYRGPPNGQPMESAGAAAFQRFLRDELIPEIERRHRADPQRRILFGQSLGGGFVVYSALTDPDLFQGRIASNPAFGAEGDWSRTAPATAARTDLGLIVVSGSRDWPALRQGVLDWAEAWRDRDAPWALEVRTLEGGTHAASAAEAYRTGLLWLRDREPR